MLKVNSLNEIDVNPTILKRMIQTLKTPKLSNSLFVSRCNGILNIIRNSKQIVWSKYDLFEEVFSVFRNFSTGYAENKYHQESPYKIIWIEELIL